MMGVIADQFKSRTVSSTEYSYGLVIWKAGTKNRLSIINLLIRRSDHIVRRAIILNKAIYSKLK